MSPLCFIFYFSFDNILQLIGDLSSHFQISNLKFFISKLFFKVTQYIVMKSSASCCTEMSFIVLHCIVLYCIVLYCGGSGVCGTVVHGIKSDQKM